MNIILLIDDNIKENKIVINSLLSNVDHIFFNSEINYYELLEKISNKKYDRIGIFQENKCENNYKILHSKINNYDCPYELINIDPSTFSDVEFITELINRVNITDFDIISCDVGKDINWKIIAEYFSNKYKININFSNGIIGKGGNWILDYGNINLIGTYFTSNIDYYEENLGYDIGSTYVITSDNILHGVGYNTNLNYVDKQLTFTNSKTLTFTDTSIALPLPKVVVVKVACGLNHTVALLSDGSLCGCGSN